MLFYKKNVKCSHPGGGDRDGIGKIIVMSCKYLPPQRYFIFYKKNMYITHDLYLAFRQLVNQLDKAKKSKTIIRYSKIEKYNMFKTYYKFHIEAQSIAYML